MPPCHGLFIKAKAYLQAYGAAVFRLVHADVGIYGGFYADIAVEIESVSYLWTELGVVETGTCMFQLYAASQIQTVLYKTVTERGFYEHGIQIAQMTIADSGSYHPAISDIVSVLCTDAKRKVPLLITDTQACQVGSGIVSSPLELGMSAKCQHGNKQECKNLLHNGLLLKLII